MYNNSRRSSGTGYRSSNSFSSSGRGHRGNGGSSRRGGFRGGRGGGRYGGRGRSNKSRDALDINKYIKKATPKKPEEAYVPQHKFNDFKISDSLKRNIAARGYVNPTPIQDKVMADIINGKDAIGIANTGTGKTAAFLLPLINKIQLDRHQKVLIMVPTRELANQIYEEFRAFGNGLGIYATTVIGGESIYRQINNLRRRPHIVIGTPGRIGDLEERRVLNLGEYTNIVLDEVDRMVDMGFIDEMRVILGKLPKERQSLFFSATMSNTIETLIRSFLHNPVMVSVKTQPTSDNVDQDIVRVESKDRKIEQLHDILIQEDVKKTLIFVRTKVTADKLDNELYDRGFKTTSLHGDKSQYMRQKSLNKFKEGAVNILVATDVAARGLDIPNVTHVINYDVPENYDDYVHRIGRTGRGNNTGKALTFVD